MKVKDLIKFLQDCDPELDVYYYKPGCSECREYDGETQAYDVSESTTITYNPDQYGIELTKGGNPRKFRGRYYSKKIVRLY